MFPVATLSAQQPITQAQVDTLLVSNNKKTKIIHINGGWCRVCYQMLPFIDYLNQHKPSHIEITVILTNPRNSNRGQHKLIHWLRERGIDLNYYVMSATQYQQSDLHQSIPVTYVVGSDGNMYRFVGSTDMHKKNILHPIQKNVSKTIEAVDAIYKKRKEDLRKIINYDDKEYELEYSEQFTLQGTEGVYNTHVKLYEGDVVYILAQGKIRLGVREGYTTPEGLSDDTFKAHSLIESINHGKLMAFLNDKNGKALQGVEVGTGVRFKATTSGKLVLKINDKYYKNNYGHFEGKIMRFGLVKD